jgi:hypothetical protein
MSRTRYEPEYLRGIDHFNAHEFFEAHEAWEDVWKRTQGPKRLFYKGLIHAAVALHHFRNGNLHGARKVFASCVGYLTPYQPRYLGLDLNGLLAQLRRCCDQLDAGADEATVATFHAEQIPRIVLDPPAVAAPGGAA